jgi:hypothetical protein
MDGQGVNKTFVPRKEPRVLASFLAAVRKLADELVEHPR